MYFLWQFGIQYQAAGADDIQNVTRMLQNVKVNTLSLLYFDLPWKTHSNKCKHAWGIGLAFHKSLQLWEETTPHYFHGKMNGHLLSVKPDSYH